MREILEGAIETFNWLAGDNEKMRQAVRGIKRLVEIRLEDGEEYNFLLEGTTAHPLVVGKAETPADIVIVSSETTLREIMAGHLSPVKAMAKKELRIKASIMDLLLMRKFFSG